MKKMIAVLLAVLIIGIMPAFAAQSKGLSATGMKLSVDDLKPNNIVFCNNQCEGHYSVVMEITNESVYLATPAR